MNFKATVLGATASVLAFGAALAADLPSVKAPPPPPPMPPVFNWTGYHFGLSGGYAGGNVSYLSNVVALGNPGVIGLTNLNSSYGTSGGIVGFESGTTWQLPNNFVVGYESEFNYTGTGSSNNGNWSGNALNSRLRWLGAERLRFGYAFGRILPYITGGLSYGQVIASGVTTAGGLLFPTYSSHWQAGWNVGAGVEWAFTDNLSVKAEYLHVHLQGANGGSVGVPWGSAVPAGYRSFVGNGFDTNIGRIGVNYHLKSLGALIGMPELGL
jgi:outer membrane immunogenic protein